MLKVRSWPPSDPVSRMLSCVEPAKYWHWVLAVVSVPAAGPVNGRFWETAPATVGGLDGALDAVWARETDGDASEGDWMVAEHATAPNNRGATMTGLVTG